MTRVSSLLMRIGTKNCVKWSAQSLEPPQGFDTQVLKLRVRGECEFIVTGGKDNIHQWAAKPSDKYQSFKAHCTKFCGTFNYLNFRNLAIFKSILIPKVHKSDKSSA